MRTTTLFLIVFGIFLIALIFIDIMMIVSMLKTGDERRKLMVWKASFFYTSCKSAWTRIRRHNRSFASRSYA